MLKNVFCQVRKNSQRQAFTLVELLVVIAIIASLMGLLLPAIQSAREAGRRNTCMNNISQLGKAAFLHDNELGYIPGWRNSVEYTQQPTAGQKVRAVVPWSVRLLPYLERRDIYRLIEVGDPGNKVKVDTAVQIPLFECPSSPGENDTAPRQCYAGNAGYGCGVDDSGFTAAQKAKGNGVMADAVGTTGHNGVRIALDAVSSQDGTSTTLLFAESCGTAATANRWDNGGYMEWNVIVNNQPTVISTPNFKSKFDEALKDPSSAAITNRPAVFIHRGIPDDGGTPTAAFGDKPINPPGGLGGSPFLYPSSNHGAGICVAFCDGHTQFVKDTIPFSVYAQLMTWDGTNSRFVDSSAGYPVDRLPILPADFAK